MGSPSESSEIEGSGNQRLSLIEVFLKTTPQGNFSGLELKGHSTLSVKGADPLCAAVSVLTENLGESIRELLTLNPEIYKADGEYRLNLVTDQIDERTDLLFSSVVYGLRVLSLQFPDELKLKLIEFTTEESNGS